VLFVKIFKLFNADFVACQTSNCDGWPHSSTSLLVNWYLICIHLILKQGPLSFHEFFNSICDVAWWNTVFSHELGWSYYSCQSCSSLTASVTLCLNILATLWFYSAPLQEKYAQFVHGSENYLLYSCQSVVGQL